MPRTSTIPGSLQSLDAVFPSLVGWAETLGDALGRGMARGLTGALGANPVLRASGRARAANACSVAGCGNPARSKGLCSKHYQAARRKKLVSA